MTKLSDIYFPTGEIEKTFINSIWRLSENDLNERKEIILPSQQVEILLIWIRKKIAVSNFQLSISRANILLSLSNQHNLTVNHICQQVCLSDRQLRRFAQDWLGMNTEEFIQYHKYLYCLHLLRHSKQTLTEIGLEAGYYDQSHFIREFKSYTDLTPKQYRQANTEIAGHIFL
jgi:AraC-like DNA-binding protein